MLFLKKEKENEENCHWFSRKVLKTVNLWISMKVNCLLGRN